MKVTLRYADDASSVPGGIVSDTFFEVLGTTAAAGRLLEAVDDRAHSDAVVLGLRTWQRSSVGSADAIGQAVLVGDRSCSFVGVAPDRFTGTGSWLVGDLDPPQVWVPPSVAGNLSWVAKWYAPVLSARLARGVARE